MADLPVTLTLRDANGVGLSLLDAVAARLRSALSACLPAVSRRVGQAAADAARASPEYQSLLGGRLRAELGVVDAGPTLEAVLEAVRSGCRATSLGARRSGNGVEGGLRVELLPADYARVLRAAGGSFTSEGGYDVPWLRWLTLAGDRILVADHKVAYGFPDRSRTGTAVMASPGSWRVPPEFAGVAGDNWLSRAVARSSGEVGRVIAEELGRAV